MGRRENAAIGSVTSRIQPAYGSYVEPFFGGGALFFNLRPGSSVIADINPELINLYQAVADNVEFVIGHLASTEIRRRYSIKSVHRIGLYVARRAAARTIYLNRTCFNGLYRVNKRGQFNVPYGRYRNPKILDAGSLRSASALFEQDKNTLRRLQNCTGATCFIRRSCLSRSALLPISKYADFRRIQKSSSLRTTISNWPTR